MAVTQIGTPAALTTRGTTNSVTATPVVGVWNSTQPRAAGDFLVACVDVQASVSCTAITTPAGWTLLTTVEGLTTKSATAMYYKFAAGADAVPSIAYTATTTTSATCTLYNLRGVNTLTPVDTFGVAAQISGTHATITATTSGSVSASGEFAIGTFSSEATSATATITVNGSGTLDTSDATINSIGHSGTVSNSSPTSGSALTAGINITSATRVTSAMVAVFKAAPTVVTLVGSPGEVTATAGTEPITGVYGQTTTLGNILVAVVGLSNTSAHVNSFTTPSGWSILVPQQDMSSTAGSMGRASAIVFYKIAAGADAAPSFVFTAAGTFTASATIFEFESANRNSPLYGFGVYNSSGSGVGSSTLNFVETAEVGAAGQYAIALQVQERQTQTTGEIWTDTGSQTFTQVVTYPASATNSFQWHQVSSIAGPTAGFLTAGGAFTDNTAGYGVGLLVLIAGINPTTHIATGIGAAGSPVPQLSVNAGLAHAAGTALSPTVASPGLTVSAGLATATGTAQSPTPGVKPTAGLAHGAGTAQQPKPSLGVKPGLAHATGTAQPPGTGRRTSGLAHGTGAAGSPVPKLAVNAGLAHASGTAQNVINNGPIVQSTVITGSNSGNLPRVTTAGNTLVVIYEGTSNTAGLPSVTGITLGGAADNFAAAITQNEGTQSYSVSTVWADANCAGGQTAVAVSGTNLISGDAYIMVLELAGQWTLDKSSTGPLGTGIPTWTSNTTATTTVAEEVIVGGTAHGPFSAADTLTGPGLPWTNGPSYTWSGGSALAGYQVSSATGAFTYSGASVGFDYYTCVIATFMPLAAVNVNAGLAHAAGTAQAPGTGRRISGLAHATGTSQPPVAGLKPNASLAHGTGTAQSPKPGLKPTAGLAHATGTAQQPKPQLAVNAGLAHAAGAAQQPKPQLAVHAGLAQASGSSFSPKQGRTPGLAHATGTAQQPKPQLAVNAGLAHASGSSLSPKPQLGIKAGLAHGAGAAQQPGQGRTPGLAHATGTSQSPKPQLAVHAGLAHASGTALSPSVSGSGTANAGLAHGAGTAQSPKTSLAVHAGLAHAAGTAQSPVAKLVIKSGFAHAAGTAQSPGINQALHAGLAHAAGTAQSLVAKLIVRAGLAHASGVALGPPIAVPVRNPQNLGGSIGYDNFLGGMITQVNLGGMIVYGNLLGGLVTYTNFLGGGVTYTNFLGGTISVPSATLGGAVTLALSYGGSTIGWTMQQATLALAEFNDETLDIALTSSSSALDLTSATVNMLLKTAAGTPDNEALTLSSAGGSPAITITNAPGGLITVAIPNMDLQAEIYSFYRIDVVFSGLQNTALYGPITWTSL